MKSVFALSAMLLASSSAFAADKTAKKEESVAPFKTKAEQLGYAVGIDLGNSIKSLDIEIDADMIKQGFIDSNTGKKLKITEQQARDALYKEVQKSREKQMAKVKEEAEANKKVGADFLKKNAKASGVKTTKSGLQYKVVKAGKGDKPAETSTVKVHYKGTLLDGKEFDSSYKRNKPAEFALNQVIKGWTEGLQLMSPGAKYTFWIKPELAYGERNTPTIPGNSTLKFEVELLEIVKKNDSTAKVEKETKK